MTINYSSKELLASTAVFAEMANKNVSLKQILNEFVLSTYSLQSVFSQTVNDISQALSIHFDFEIPEAVVRTVLKRLKKDEVLALEEGKYIISTEERNKWSKFISKVESKESEQKLIKDQLISFVELNRGQLSDDKKSDLLSCFSDFLFDESFEDKYSDIVSTFIIKNSNEGSFTSELNLIREGITILKGIKYNPEINTLKPWRKPLTIYLDTEHLFNICGYNGEVYKKLVWDLLDLTTALNQEQLKQGKEKAISFKYLEETEMEIKAFFYAARKIISGERNRGSGSVAMDSILKGVTTSSEIIRKESEFFRSLLGFGIVKQDAIDLFQDHRFNVEDKSIHEKYSNDHSSETISNILKSFTALNIQRKGQNNNSFENIGHIMMTGSWIKLRLSSDIETKINDGDFSYATHIYYVTQRLWFRMNRGLGFTNNLPSSLDVVTKAQMLLSTHLNSSVRDRYNKLEDEVASGKKTLDSVKDYYVNLRANVSKPEDLVPDNVEERVKFLYEEKDLENFQEEQSVLRQKADELDRLRAIEDVRKKEAEKQKRQEFEDTRRALNSSSLSRYKLFRRLAIGVFIVLILSFIYLILIFRSPSDTPIGIISLVLTSIGAFAVFKRKSFDNFIKKVSYKKLHEFEVSNPSKELD